MARRKLLTQVKIVPAVIPTAGAVAAITATEVNGTGYDRVAWIIATGAAAAGATIAAKIQSATATGGSFADVSGAASAGLTAAANASKIQVIDMPVNAAKPFMKVVGAVGTDTFANACVAVLYNGRAFPVSTAYATELVQL